MSLMPAMISCESRNPVFNLAARLLLSQERTRGYRK